MVPWRVINWHVLQIDLRSTFQEHDSIHDFRKKITRCMFLRCVVYTCTKNLKKACNTALNLPSYGLVVFIDMNMYILVEGMFSKTFLEENYPVSSNNCYLFIKKIVNMELSMMLIVLMELTCIRSKLYFLNFTADLMNIL